MLTCSVMLWGGRDAANKSHWRVLTVPQPRWAYPPHGACSLPAHTAQALGCSAGNHPWPALAPPGSKPLRFRHSGSPQRRRLGWACVLCSSHVRAAQVMRCLVSANAAAYRLPATRLSGCKTGAPSQADVDRPDPQEVLVNKEACLQFYR